MSCGLGLGIMLSRIRVCLIPYPIERVLIQHAPMPTYLTLPNIDAQESNKKISKSHHKQKRLCKLTTKSKSERPDEGVVKALRISSDTNPPKVER